MPSAGILRDDTLRLRPLALPDDIAPAVAWYHDPEVLHFSEGAGTPPYDAAMVERMYRMTASRCEVYIIETLTATGWQPIGDAALCREGGVPIVIGDAAYRSRGLGARVLRLLIARARSLGWPKLVAKGIYTVNDRSRRLFERAGFRLCDEFQDDEGRSLRRFELPLA